MPFEAYPVRGVVEGYYSGNNPIESVSKEIASIYQQVDDRGGEVVGQHKVGADFSHSSNTWDKTVLFIVAKFPEVIAE